MRMETGLVFCVPDPEAAAAPEQDASGTEMPGFSSLQCITHRFPSLESSVRADCDHTLGHQIEETFAQIFSDFNAMATGLAQGATRGKDHEMALDPPITRKSPCLLSAGAGGEVHGALQAGPDHFTAGLSIAFAPRETAGDGDEAYDIQRWRWWRNRLARHHVGGLPLVVFEHHFAIHSGPVRPRRMSIRTRRQ